jgi:lipopolysaccharide transport system ATP-binding protein
MPDIAIRVDRLSKLYRIGAKEHAPRTLGQTARNLVTAPFDYLRRMRRPPTEEETLWALRDVSFEVKPGEVVGIIGRNGAGKSTLLKILSRITEPTSGRAEIHGRIASLLEVGTGFHPELTGRENIYLNGAILGMKKVEIERKFAEIVAFAEIERFLDTPVKRYSSGMYVRLAFAVAAHLEPEILLVDEVLAVGDAAFQKKCLGRMGDVAKEGRTVLFVSHNMAAMLSLCVKAILLDAGKVIQQGAAQEVVRSYFQAAMSLQIISLDQRVDRSGDGTARMVSLQIVSTDPDGLIRSTSRLKITIDYKSMQPIQYPTFLVGIYDQTNTGIFLLNSDAVGGLPEILPSQGSVVCLTEPVNLTPGRCYVNLALQKGGSMADYVQYAGVFDLEADDVYGSGKVPSRDWVICVLKHQWSLDGSSIV